MSRIVRPRHAATLVVHREGSRGTEILMGRRAGRHRFMPDFYVFPGGRLDAGDYRVVPLSRLKPQVENELLKSCAPRQAQALAVAAIRETYEETGLALGRREGNGMGVRPHLQPLDYVLRAITPPSSPIRFHARFFAVEAVHMTGTLRGNGELLDLDWRPLDECLRLPLADVTEFLLQRLKGRMCERKEEARKGVPLFSFRRGVARVRL